MSILNLSTAAMASIWTTNTVYQTALSGSGAGAPTTTDLRIGQRYIAPNYGVYQLFVEFSLADLPVGATITAATLKMVTASYNDSATNFIHEVYERDFGASIESADFLDLSGAGFSGTILASFDAADWTNSTEETFTENGTNLRDAIAANAGGPLRLMLISDRSRANTTPTGAEYNNWISATLDIEYTVSGQTLAPDADTDAGGWTTTPLWSKVNDDDDATFISATSS